MFWLGKHQSTHETRCTSLHESRKGLSTNGGAMNESAVATPERKGLAVLQAKIQQSRLLSRP
ncbi:hypothetical protein QFZ34_002204 [Phyllobacterium ifriqiyense]|uniref:Uncharacterized protein n=1 Tax=Phyllobacterium ifriqiyense TaxID=314238 RepID=A0ABU0S8F2_9HYPH|nr:hypothetical protein [Phyllobacterium ifriqiyense]